MSIEINNASYEVDYHPGQGYYACRASGAGPDQVGPADDIPELQDWLRDILTQED